MKTRKIGRSQLGSKLGAVSLQLTEDDLGKIASALAQVKVQGDRYPAALPARIGR